MYDLAIVGAGPAGATLARLLGRDYRILLIDRRELQVPYAGGPENKSCGGLLAPDAQRVLGMMGLALPRDVLVGPQIFVVRTIDLQSKQEQYYQRFYLNLDREKFDRWLLSLLPAAVDLRTKALCQDIEIACDHYVLKLVQNGKHYHEQARCLVGADGAASIVRKKLFLDDRQMLLYVALQEWYAAEDVVPHFSVFFDPEVTDFYGWTIPKDRYLLFGAALTPRKETQRAFLQLKHKLDDYGYSLTERVKRDGALIIRPRQAPRMIAAEPGAVLIGEAAGWISPSSAEGFSYAFRSAILAAECFNGNPGDFVRSYKKNAAVLRRNIFLKNVKLPFMYHPWLRGLVMGSGVESLRIKGSS